MQYIYIKATQWPDAFLRKNMVWRKWSQEKQKEKKKEEKDRWKTKEQMTNIIVNQTQRNAILVMAYQNTQCFLKTLRCVSRKRI
jgi:phosphoribosyl-AMP cyclohydrolase